MKIRNFLFALMLTVFAIASVASAQVNSASDGFNRGTLELKNTGWSSDQVRFTVPTSALAHPDGYFRPDARIEVRVPITNSTKRAVICSAEPSWLDAVAKGVADVQNATNINIGAGATGTMTYFIQMKPESEWTTWDRFLDIRFNILCEGILPNIVPQSF